MTVGDIYMYQARAQRLRREKEATLADEQVEVEARYSCA